MHNLNTRQARLELSFNRREALSGELERCLRKIRQCQRNGEKLGIVYWVQKAQKKIDLINDALTYETIIGGKPLEQSRWKAPNIFASKKDMYLEKRDKPKGPKNTLKVFKLTSDVITELLKDHHSDLGKALFESFQPLKEKDLFDNNEIYRNNLIKRPGIYSTPLTKPDRHFNGPIGRQYMTDAELACTVISRMMNL